MERLLLYLSLSADRDCNERKGRGQKRRQKKKQIEKAVGHSVGQQTRTLFDAAQVHLQFFEVIMLLQIISYNSNRYSV